MRHLLFSLDRMEFRGDGTALVAGRNCGEQIRAGDAVTAMVRLSIDDGVTHVLETETVDLTMPIFHMLSRELDALDPGYTAGVFFDAESATGLRLGWYLSGENA